MYPEYSRAWCTMSEKHTSGHCRWIPLTVLFVILFCSAAASAATASAATTAACPSGCSCMQPAAAQEKGYDACGGQLTACGYDVFQKTMYCYKTPQIVIPVRTLQTLVIATTTQPGSCPAGCSCMMEAEAKEKFGSYYRCSETPCYSVVTGSATLKAYCFRQGTPPATTTPAPACPPGCTCLSDAQAKERYGTYTRCTENVCGYDIPANMVAAYQIPKYCVKQGTTTPVCPDGCVCITDAMAKQRYGTFTRCTADICGYDQSRTPEYCIKQGSTSVCPEGCSCISEETAKARGGTWNRCTNDVCGYEQSTATLAAVVQVPKYCMKQQETAPVCPEGCTCLTDAQAKERYGTYTRCSADVCGYQMSAPTNALASGQIPKYCVKQGTTPACPDGCACISEEDAKLKGLTERCDNSQTPCGYRLDSSSATTAARRIPLYCFKLPSTTKPVCPEGCSCLSEAKAKERYGVFTRCSEEVCGKEVIQPAGAAAYSVPQYCVKQGSTPVCPEGCTCISEEDAKLKGLTDRCDNSQTPCGYKTAATTANQRIPLFCYKIPTTAPVCPQGCYCLQAAEADLKFGPNNYTRCQAEPCGYDPSAASANGIPRYCFKPAATPVPPGCPQGCLCTTDEIAKLKGLTPCRGQRTSCGTNSANQPQYCFEQVPSPTCVYDYQKNACAGACPDGYTCGVLASRKDESGKVEYAVCGCTGKPTGECAWDKEKQACTGTCQNGASCAIVGKKVDDKTGEVYVNCGCPQPPSGQCAWDKEKKACTGTCQNGAACTVTGTKKDDAGNEYVFCGCPQQTSCLYDYSKEACVGTCPVTGDNCQLNTIYHDPTTGKVTYAECHCKGGGGTPDTCAFNADNYCVGSCPNGGQCANTSVYDASGKQSFVCTCAGGSSCVLTANNECTGTCATGAPCTRTMIKDDSGNEKVSCICGGPQPATTAGMVSRPSGFFEGIGEFFRRLFGGK